LQSRGALAKKKSSSLPQCGSNKRLQLRQQDLKSINMAASEDGGGVVVAEALGRKISQPEVLLGGSRKRLQQGRDRSTLDGGRNRLQRGCGGSWL
jgi:hypothetical protein